MVQFLQKKRIRLAIAGGMLLIVVIAVLPYFFNFVSYSAFVNAELVRISAPISGAIAQSLPSDGEYIVEDRTLNLVEGIAPDRHRLAELEQQRASTFERLTLARTQLAAIEEREIALSTRADAFTAFTQAITFQDAVVSEAELTTCRVEEDRLRADRDRTRRLADTGAAPHLSVTLAQADLDSQSARCAAAEARVSRARVKQEAAEHEIFLEDGVNDVPYSVQELDRLFLRRLDLEAEIGEADVMERELALLIDGERERFDHATRFEAILPAQHVVWSVRASEGTAVVEGQTLIELADCRNRFVSVLLSERAVGAVAVGDSAAVRLVGSSRWTRGRVTSVSGSAARRDIQLLAAELPEPSPNRFLVQVALPESAVEEPGGDRCGVGRMAEVRFHRFGLDLAPAPERTASVDAGPA